MPEIRWSTYKMMINGTPITRKMMAVTNKKTLAFPHLRCWGCSFTLINPPAPILKSASGCVDFAQKHATGTDLRAGRDRAYAVG